jgi:RNA polymerase sigma-70 factor (ECF subfamily)
VPERTDEELIREVRACTDPSIRRELLDTLFLRYHSRIAVWCYRTTGNRDSATDLAQEILLKAYQNLDGFRGDAKFSTWLYSITRNHCFNDAQRRVSQRENVMDPLEPETRVDDRFDLRLEHEEDLQQMRNFLRENLDETEQRVMTLHYGEEIPLDAVTRLLGLSNASGAKAYIVSARRKLNTAVGRWRARQKGGARHE